MEGGVIENSETTLGSLSSDDSDSHGCCNPKRRPWRFLGLALMCFLGFGPFFCYDTPSALQDYLKQDLELSTKKFVLLYSIYSWPNVILCFIGGFLLDSVFGIRLGTIIYMALALIGQIIFATGAILNIFWMMMIGRLIFGIGSESLAVAQNSYAVLWFKGKELNMVFGLQLSFARLGSTVNFLIMEPIYKYVAKEHSGPECIGIVLFLASFTCVLSMICGTTLGVMDRRTEIILKRGHNQEPKVIRLTDMKTFPGIFWLIAFICVTYYLAIFPFIALGKVYFERKYHFAPETANQVISLLYSISAVASPFCGIIVDKTGKNVMWVFLSIIGTILAHGLLTFSYNGAHICIIVMGLSYSMLAASLWPLIALVVPEYHLGTAYGIAQAVQNLGLAIVSIMAGIIVDEGGYFMLEIFFLAWLWISLITSAVIWICDLSNSNGYLNMTPNQRRLYETCHSNTDSLEREQLLSTGSTSDLSADDLFSPTTDNSIRNRYLTRIGPIINHH